MRRAPRAVLLDVDGTLYHQGPLRLCMALELVASGRRSWSAIRAFRRVREDLRDLGVAEAPLVRLQSQLTAERQGMPVEEVEAAVSEWIYRRPLKYLLRCRRRGIEGFLDYLESRGISAGVFSDYPAREKLEALQLAAKISLVACATDTEINAFKPHPRGFLWSCQRWGLEPAEVLYVGDRPEVDAAGAAKAGMPCAILSGKLGLAAKRSPSSSFSRFTSFAGLQHAIDAGS
jgi:HAD superfamily hydrolase (TIGR01549 family)